MHIDIHMSIDRYIHCIHAHIKIYMSIYTYTCAYTCMYIDETRMLSKMHILTQDTQHIFILLRISISAPMGLSTADNLSHKRMLLEPNSSLKGDPKCMAEPPGSQTVHIIMRLYDTIMRLEELKNGNEHPQQS